MSHETSTVATNPTSSTWRMAAPLRRVLLLLPPLALACLEAVHPMPDHTLQALLDESTWFAVFHVIQLVLTGLVGLSVLLLADSYGRADAWTTRLGVGIFLVFFSAYEAIAGIGTGLAMRSARDLPPAGQEGVFAVVKDWPSVSEPFALSIVGTPGWVVAVGGIAMAARRQGTPWYVWVLLGISAIALLGGHPFPAGTIAFGCFFLAALLAGDAPPVGQPSKPTRSSPRSR